MVEPMLNILCKDSFCDFVKIPQKVSSLPLLQITTQSTHFLPGKKIPILWIEPQIKYKRSQNLTAKHHAVKNWQTAKTFWKNVNTEAT